MIRLLKPLSFLPAIVLMYMIFTFSSQDGVTSSQLSYKVSYKVVETAGELLDADFETWEIDNLATRFHGVIRKLAHMTEYFALAVAVAFPLYVYGLRGILLMLVAGMFCVAFACGDEYHQSYIDGRSPSSRDVLIDSFGVFWGIVLVRIVGWTGRKTIFRPFSRKKRRKQQEPAQAPYPQQGYPQPYPQGNSFMPQGSYAAPNGSPQGNGYMMQGGAQGISPQGGYAQPGVSYYPPRGNASQQITQPQGGACPNTGAHPNAGTYQNPGAFQNTGAYQNPGTHQMPPYGAGYGPYPYPPAAEKVKNDTSDRLSEDMSFKKLVKDLKEQKSEQKR